MRLDDDEISEMIQDAEKFKIEYAAIRRCIEQRQEAEHLLARLRRRVTEKGEKLSAELLNLLIAAETILGEVDLDAYCNHLRDLWHWANETDSI